MTSKETTQEKSIYALVVGLLAVAIIMAAFFRFYRLSQIPPGFTFDEASHALDALDILNGQLMLVSPRLRQTPTGYMYLLAITYTLFGASILVQRTLTAIFGLLLIPVTFVAARALFNRAPAPKATWVAVFSALLTASSYWGVTASRIGYEYILPPVFALLAAYFFWRGYPHENWRLLLVAAIFTAVEFYLYEGSAPFLLVIPTAVVLHRLINKVWSPVSPQEPRVSWKVLLFYGLVVTVVALPMFMALLSGPNPEAERSLRLSVFSRADGPTEAFGLLVNSFMTHLRPFLALDGDVRWFSNLYGRPILNPLLAACFVAGWVICLKRVRRLPYLFLLVYWIATLAPAILTVAGSPFYFRMINALPPTYMIIAIAWVELYGWLKRFLNSIGRKQAAWWVALSPFLLVVLVWLPIETYRDYFLRWAPHPKVAYYHDVSVINLVERMKRESNPQAIFILPRDPASPRPNYILDFLYHGPAPLLYLPVDGTVRQTLTARLAGYDIVHLITGLAGGREADQRNADPIGLLPLLFEKYGRLVETEKNEDYAIKTYQLDSKTTNFEAHLQAGVPPDFEPLAHILAGQIKLAGIKRRLENNTLYLDLAWQGHTKAVADYTVFVQLLNPQEQRVTGVDVLPEQGFTLLDQQEVMTTSYIIPLANVEPGTYTLLVGLYYLVGDEVINVDAVVLGPPVVLK